MDFVLVIQSIYCFLNTPIMEKNLTSVLPQDTNAKLPDIVHNAKEAIRKTMNEDYGYFMDVFLLFDTGLLSNLCLPKKIKIRRRICVVMTNRCCRYRWGLSVALTTGCCGMVGCGMLGNSGCANGGTVSGTPSHFGLAAGTQTKMSFSSQM